MKNFIKNIITFSLRNKFFILFLTLLVVIFGIYCFEKTPVDAFPDITNTNVTIITQWPGRSAEEVEKFVTIPIELAMNPVQKKTIVRSTTLFGLSVVNVLFDDHIDDSFARQQVYNLIKGADLPEGVSPEVQPATGPTGEIYRYTLQSNKRSVRELKTLQDWVLDRQLRSVPGVADVVSFGGEVKTFEVQINPNQLNSYGISNLELYNAIEKCNLNVGGDIVNKGAQAYIVRGIGLISNIKDLENVVVKNINGTPILVKNVATVKESSLPRLGQCGIGDKNDVVEGMVLMHRGDDPGTVIPLLKKKLADIQAQLPKDVKIVPFYDRTNLINVSVHTVLHNLTEGLILVTIIVFLFMADWRTTINVAIVVPLSLLFAFICLYIKGMSANLISMGAIDIGIIIDGAVVMVEGLFVALDAHAKKVGMNEFNKQLKLGLIRRVASDRARAVFFSKLIIITALIPIFSFQKVEGKMFSPMAYTLGFALLGALLFTLTLVPMLTSVLLKKNVKEKHNPFTEFLTNNAIRFFYICRRHKRKTLIVSIAVMIAGLSCYFLLGSEFLPELNEGSIYMRASMPSSISLDQSVRLANEIRAKLRKYPEVEDVLSQTGRPNDGTDPTGFYNVEMLVKIYPEDTWKSGLTKEQLIDKMAKDLSVYPGVDFGFSQPISDNVEEAVSGVKGSIAVKIYGDNLSKIATYSNKIYKILKTVHGITDLGVIQNIGQPELRIELDEAALSRYGIDKQTVQSVIEMAIGGKSASTMYEGEKKFNIMVRYEKNFRMNESQISKILVPAANGAMVPIGELARIRTITGPLLVFRDNNSRFGAVKFSVRGRDMGGAVAEARAKVNAQIHPDKGYKFVWAGDFENQQRATARLAQVVPISLIIIFIILFVLFGNPRDAGLVLMNIPFAAVGGIVILLITGFNFSISAGVGFICLFGICIQNGVIMVTDIKYNIMKRMSLDKAVEISVRYRIRSVLMTAMMAMLGLMPAALSHGIGSESQRPLAVVIIGGLVGATLFTLFVFPLIVQGIYRRMIYNKSGKLNERKL